MRDPLDSGPAKHTWAFQWRRAPALLRSDVEPIRAPLDTNHAAIGLGGLTCQIAQVLVVCEEQHLGFLR